jgi:hypothetical protein
MTTARAFETNYAATLLPSGKVLIAGGRSTFSGPPVASAELFDPTAMGGAGDFSGTGSMSSARDAHTATLLPNGKVLIAGGVDASLTTLSSAEIFDPAANNGAGAFTGTGSMGNPRNHHTASLLPNGKVFIAGGAQFSDFSLPGARLDSAEIFDPAANNGAGTFAPTGSMASARNIPSSILLPNGRVLVSGGADATGTTVKTAELFDPNANSGAGLFFPTGSMGTARSLHRLTLLPNAKVLTVGGFQNNGPVLNSAELYSTTICGPEITDIVTISVPNINNTAVITTVTITGSNLGNVTDGVTVTVNGVTGTISERSDSRIVITVTTPTTPTTPTVQVRVNGVRSNSPPLVAISLDGQQLHALAGTFDIQSFNGSAVVANDLTTDKVHDLHVTRDRYTLAAPGGNTFKFQVTDGCQVQVIGQ